MSNNRTVVFSVSVEFDNAEDAYAMASIIADLGYEASVASRLIGSSRHSPIRETRLGALILSAMKDGRLYRSSDFEELVESRGYKTQSINPILSKLNAEGDIVYVARGAYKLN